MFKSSHKLFEECTVDKIKKTMIKKSLEKRERELAFMPVKQDVAVLDELLEKTEAWLDALLETSEENDSFCQLQLKCLTLRWVEPIVIKETLEEFKRDRKVSVEITDQKVHESKINLTLDRSFFSSKEEVKSCLFDEIVASIVEKLIFDDENYTHGVSIDFTLTAYDSNNESLAEVRFEELFRRAPEMTCGVAI